MEIRGEKMGTVQKREPQIRTSFDEMEAYIVLPSVDDKEPWTMGEIRAALNQRNIKVGVDEELLNKMIESKTYGREVCFAKGKKAVDGEDGYYQYNFNLDFNQKPTIRPDGSVDYWSIHNVEIVEEGQVIAIYNDPVEGQDGITVTGKLLVSKRGRPQQPLVGKGFERSEDGKVYTATETGKIEMQKSRIMISSIYEVYGNVDLQTGNIDFRGDVLIHGNVTTGARIKATGTITIDGTAEGCILEANKDIILRGGMIGGERAQIRSKGNITAKFIEYSTVEADGFIEATSAMNSTLVSYDRIIFSGPHATVVGGSIYGCAGIEANSFGNNSEIKTEVYAGVHKKITQRIHVLEANIESSKALVGKINMGIKQFDEMAKERHIDVNSDERRISLLRTRIAKQAEISAYTDELTHLNAIVERSKGARVRVINMVHPGVEVSINEKKVRVKDSHKSVEFVMRNDKIVMLSIAGTVAE